MGTLVAVLLAWGAGGGDTVLLDFYTDTCPPCRQLAPVIEQFIAAGYPVRKVDLSREPDLAKRFRVDRVPCCVMLVEGREVDRVYGPVPAERIARMFALAPQASPLRGAAVQLTSAPPSSGGARAIPAVQSNSPFLASGASGAAAVEATLPRGPSPDGSPGRADRAAWTAAADSAAVRPAAAADLGAQLLGATTRIRVGDATGHSRGTGTIIDAREDWALVLTCAHIFRDSKGQGEIEVDLFGAARVERVRGKLLHYDLDVDLALISIPAVGPVQVARVAPAGYVVRKGDKAYNVGCNNGENPTVRQSHITAIDKFVGHPNIEASGAPVQGRSGGGLFSADGYLIGVCNAAVPTDNEGMYAGFKAIHTMLERKQLGYVRPEVRGPNAAPLEVVRDVPQMPAKMPPPGDLRSQTDSHAAGALDAARDDRAAGPSPRAAAAGAALSPDERAALDMIASRKAEGDEVICIINSRGKPAAASEILVIDNASPAFVEAISKGSASRRAAAPAEGGAAGIAAPRGRQSSRGDADQSGGIGRRESGSRTPIGQGPSRPDSGSQAQTQDHLSSRTVAASEEHDWQPRWLQRTPSPSAASSAGGPPSAADTRTSALASTATVLTP